MKLKIKNKLNNTTKRQERDTEKMQSNKKKIKCLI